MEPVDPCNARLAHTGVAYNQQLDGRGDGEGRFALRLSRPAAAVAADRARIESLLQTKVFAQAGVTVVVAAVEPMTPKLCGTAAARVRRPPRAPPYLTRTCSRSLARAA